MKIIFIALLVFSFCIVQGCRYRRLECPEFIVKEDHEGYDIREYPAMTWATSYASHQYDKIAQSRAYMKLASYINGNNHIKVTMNMTVPFRMNATDEGEIITYKMSFMLPSQYAAASPIPSEKGITISREPSTTYAVRKFPGLIWQRAIWLSEAEKLANSLKQDQTFDKTWFYQVGYDAPFHLLDRNNEIWMKKISEDAQNEV